MWVQYVQSYLEHSVPLFCSFQKLVSLSSHCSIPFRNWCLYHPTVLFLSETSVSIIPQFCSFQKLVSLLSHCSVPLSLRHWCLYCPAVLFFLETGVFMAPLFCSFQKPVSLSSYCSVPFRNWCPYGVGAKKRWEFWHFCASANWSGCSQNPPWNPHSRLVLCPLCVDGWVHMVLCMCVHAHSCAHPFLAYLWIIIFAGLSHWGCCCWPTLYLSLFSKNAWHIWPLTSLSCWCRYHSSTLCMSVQQVCMARLTICKFVMLMSLPLINFMHVCFSKCRWCAGISLASVADPLHTAFLLQQMYMAYISNCKFVSQMSLPSLINFVHVCFSKWMYMAYVNNCKFVSRMSLLLISFLHASLFLSRCMWTVSSLSC